MKSSERRPVEDGSRPHADRLLNLARLPNLALGALLVALVGWWAYRLWGAAGGLLVMTLAALEPTVVAHSGFVATDMGWTLFCTASLYSLWEFARSGSWYWIIAIGISTGLAFASKFSAISLAVVLPATLVCYWLLAGKIWSWPVRPDSKPLRGLDRALFAVVAAGTAVYLAVLVVWASYFFKDLLLWGDGFVHVWEHQQHGHPAFFWGAYSRDGWPDYFPVALIIKTQIATLVLATAGMPLLFRIKGPRRDVVAFLLLPMAMFFGALLVARINIGVCLALHLYPLLHILAGRAAVIGLGPKRSGRVALGLLVAWSAVSAARIAPFPVAYFNELVGGPRGGRHILTDSNLDWGQGLRALAHYLFP